MLAMILDTPGSRLQMTDLHLPACGPNDIMLKFSVCGVCRTDLHILDGELPCPKLSLVPGHKIVGTVAIKRERVKNFTIGQRLGFL